MDSSQTSVSQSPTPSSSSSPPKDSLADPSSKEKKILPGRRQQRHSTEIGSEYHRWWVVRNALGFETNEHIAGLLLDGFHGLLHQLVQMCGVKTYQPLDGTSRNNDDETEDSGEVKLSSPSCGLMFSTSPPGVIEDMEEFVEYKNAITYYCDSLWRLYGQQDSKLHELEGESQPVQDFLLKLMSYLRSAKGKSYSLGQKKKRLKTVSVTSKKTGGINLETNMSLNALPLSSLSDISPKQTSSLTLLSASSSQGMSQSNWIQGQLSPSPTSDSFKFSTASKNESGDDSSYSALPVNARDGPEMGPWTSLSPSVESDEVMSCFKDKRERHCTFSEEYMGFQKLRKKIDPQRPHIKGTDNAMLLNNSSNDKQQKTKAPLMMLGCLDTSQEMTESVCRYNTWKDIHPYGDQTSCERQKTFTSNVSKNSNKHLDQVKPDSSSNAVLSQEKYNSGNNSNDSELSNGEEVGDMTPEQHYEEQYLKMLLSNTSGSQAYKSDHCKNYFLSRPQKELLNHGIKTDVGTFPQYSLGDHSQKNTEDQKSISGCDQSSTNKVTTHDALLPTSFSMDLQTRVVSSKKINLKTNPSKCKNSATNSVGTNTLKFSETNLETKFKNYLHLKQKPAVGESKSVEKSTGRELNIQPAVPLNMDNSQSISTPLGTPVIFYPANSFSSTDSSLASLSSLVQNIVCNSHGAILKPLSLAPTSSSNTSCSGHQLISPIVTSSAENGPLHSSVAAALPVLSSQLSAGKPTLVPFYISHMNSLNGMAKYSASSSFRPSYTSTPKPIQPYMPASLPRQQGPGFYHKWSTTLRKNIQTSSASSSFSELQHSVSKSKPDCDLNNIKDVKTHGYQIQNLLSATSSGESEMLPQNQSISFCMNDSLADKSKPDLHQLCPRKCYAPSIAAQSAVVSSGDDFVTEIPEAVSQVEKKPQKKILTSLLSSKSIDYNGSNRSLTSTYNSSNSENVESLSSCNNSSALRAGKGSVSDCDPSHQMVLTQDACSKSSMEKKRRCDKSRPRRLLCSTCDLMFYSGTDLLVHRYEQHSHVCGECDGRFLSVSRLNQHKESDHPVMIRCSLCRFHTFSKQGLIDHQRLEHRLVMDSTGDHQNEHRETVSVSTVCSSNEIIQVKSKCDDVTPLNPRNCHNEQFAPVSSKTTENISEDAIERSDNFEAADHKNLSQLLSSSVSFHSLNAESTSNDMSVFSSATLEEKHSSECAVTSSVDSRKSESCNPEFGLMVDQQFSETDEPKLVIDTDLCGVKDVCGQDKETESLETYFDPKLTLKFKDGCQENYKLGIDKTKKNITRRRYPSFDRKKYGCWNKFKGSPADIVNCHLRNHSNWTLDSMQKGILNSVADENEIIDLSLPSELKEKLVMKINLKRPVNYLFDKQAVNRKKCKRKKVIKQMLSGKSIKTTEVSRETPVEGLTKIDGNCKQHDALVTKTSQEFNDKCSVHIQKIEDCGEIIAEKTNLESSIQLMAPEEILIPHTVQECLSHSDGDSQRNSNFSPLPLVKEEKFLSLRDRHVMSSLPPKKRRLRRSSRSSKSDKDVAQLSQAPRSDDNTQLFHNEKVRENNFQLSCSDKERTSSLSQNVLLRKTVDSLRIRRSLDHRYMCPVPNCGATFSRKWNLDGHISKVHYKLSSLICSVSGCQKTFSSKRELRQHITVDHKGKTRKYKCSWPDCNKSFFARTHLRIHNLTHTGEKPVACDICDYRCRQRTALVWHMRKHDCCQKDTVTELTSTEN